eukprot:SAG22_NODE_15662_length_344_cov_0.457143_1_plen_74_part_01
MGFRDLEAVFSERCSFLRRKAHPSAGPPPNAEQLTRFMGGVASECNAALVRSGAPQAVKDELRKIFLEHGHYDV